MNIKNTIQLVTVGLFVLSLAVAGFAQKTKPIIFAVINDGKTIEPIAHFDGKKLVKTVTGDEEFAKKQAFGRSYFKNKSRYKLIFSGVNSGLIKVNSFSPDGDCSSNMASIQTDSSSAKLKGYVMGLATDIRTDKTASGVRRLPTQAERNRFTSIVRSELTNKKVSHQQLKSMKYHNLTAIDVDGSGKAELIGTYWVNLSKNERGLMFVIVDVGRNGRYSMNLSKYSTIKQKDVMNQEIATVDKGVYHEFLLDYFDYDNDGVSEIFTIVQGFEGSTFYVYKRDDNQWKIEFEVSNYHCGS